MIKQRRPYIQLETPIDGNIFAIPIRRRITHKYAFFTRDHRGLDYTKAVMIEDARYISDQKTCIQAEEYYLIRANGGRIFNGLRAYLKVYQNAREHPNTQAAQNILRYGSLRYFLPGPEENLKNLKYHENEGEYTGPDGGPDD